MAIRYAGQIFARPVAEEREPTSYLTDYFPDLKDLSKRGSVPAMGEARSTSGFQAVAPFAGFKPMQKQEEKEVPAFAGYKPSGYSSNN